MAPRALLTFAALHALAATGCAKRTSPEVAAPPGVADDTQAAAATKAPAPPPPESIGVRRAVDAADKAIDAEQIQGDYRIGMGVQPARSVFLAVGGGRMEDPPFGKGQVYLVVTVREARTKRHLPRAGVTVAVPRTHGRLSFPPLRLLEVWGEFAHYGANVPLPRGHEVQVSVTVNPPSYGRLADSVGLWTQAASATFLVQRDGDKLTVQGDPPGPADPSWQVGADVVDGLKGVSQLVDAGEYAAGLIVEGPKRSWQWQEGKAVVEPVSEKATHQLSVLLMEKVSGRIVTGAGITLTLRPAAADQPEIQVPLMRLMSNFHHYGAPAVVPPGTYRVGVKIIRPSFTTLVANSFHRTLSFTFPDPWTRSP